ncbi:hypothetical protein [Clostridium sp.]|nr:hypothetical protein [Clostridium sp.]
METMEIADITMEIVVIITETMETMEAMDITTEMPSIGYLYYSSFRSL